MNIKTKLRLGFGFLFVIVITFGGISLYHINQISQRAKVVLKDNYESLVYVSEMRTLLENHTDFLSDTDKLKFEKLLQKEEHNVTEIREKEAVITLRESFEQLGSLEVDNSNAFGLIRSSLRAIEKVNMDAIVRKNDNAQKATERASLFLGVTAFFTFLILFSFIVNFPGFIANPLRDLLIGIQEISKKNYKQQLYFKGNDEFNELAVAFNKMALALRNWDNSNIAKIKSEKQRIETIVEQMQDAIIGINEKQEILFFNKVAVQLLNLNPNQIVGANAIELSSTNELLKRILSSEYGDKPLKIYADEKESYFQLEHREILIPNLEESDDSALQTSTRSAGMVYVLKNITKFKELDEAKTNFIATVSHELKTPLSSIKMSLKLLADDRVGKMNAEQNQLINHIKEDSDRLLKLTSELLDLAQVETGNLQLNFVKTDPLKIVNFALDAVRFQAEQKQIQMELICKNNLPFINADVQKTAWVLVNFLSNALRYSSVKSKLIISVIPQTQQLVFSVKDFGKGIEEQYQKRLFDRYYQVPTDGQNKSGSGLGLAISKDFIEAQNGKIWVESAIGEGSKFSFSMPVI